MSIAIINEVAKQTRLCSLTLNSSESTQMAAAMEVWKIAASFPPSLSHVRLLEDSNEQ
jgi:hypothetical protein